GPRPPPGPRLRDPRRRARDALQRAAAPPRADLRRARQRDQARADHRRGLPRRAHALSDQHDETDGAPHHPMATSLLTRDKARVDLHPSNRSRGSIGGRGRCLSKGSGEDFDELKSYQPGDESSGIDWRAPASSGGPLIRQFYEERVRYLSIVVDIPSA